MQSNFMGRDGFQWFTGVVEDNNDPKQVGRVRVRAIGYHTQDKTALPTDDLPWATVMQPTTSPAVSGVGSHTFLLSGSWVVGFWRDIDCQEPIIMGALPGFPTAEPDTSLGFNDPSGTYPSYVNESDVNQLARGTQTHEYTVDTVISEPADPYNAEYPHNHVLATTSGHTKEYDDTPNNERIKEKHKSGTFYEIHPDGKKVTRVVGNNYEIVAGDEEVHITGSVTLNIDTNCTTNITGNWDVNVTGDITIDGSTINLNNGTKGAARIDDTADEGDDPPGISGSDGSNKIQTGSGTVFIGD
jgi:hypothetical protein